jgi:hypothetical protein
MSKEKEIGKYEKKRPKNMETLVVHTKVSTGAVHVAAQRGVGVFGATGTTYAKRIQRWWRIALLLDSQRRFRWNGTLKCRLKEELKRRQALRRIALPPGWQLRMSRSCPGLFVYFNVFTKKRIFQDTMATPTRPAAIGVYSHLAELWEDDWIFHTLVQPACRRIQRQWRRSGVREKVDHIGSRLEN